MTKELIDKFYDKTQGISDLVVKLFVHIQMRLIEKGHFKITTDIIDKVWDKEFKLINPMVNSIKSDNLVNKFKYEDIQKLSTIDVNIDKCKNKNIKTELKVSEEIVNTPKRNKIKVEDLKNDDIRKIIFKNKDKTTYEILKEANLIKSVEEILC